MSFIIIMLCFFNRFNYLKFKPEIKNNVQIIRIQNEYYDS